MAQNNEINEPNERIESGPERSEGAQRMSVENQADSSGGKYQEQRDKSVKENGEPTTWKSTKDASYEDDTKALLAHFDKLDPKAAEKFLADREKQAETLKALIKSIESSIPKVQAAAAQQEKMNLEARLNGL